MARTMQRCGIIDGKYSIWHARSYLPMMEEIHGGCHTTCLTNCRCSFLMESAAWSLSNNQTYPCFPGNCSPYKSDVWHTRFCPSCPFEFLSGAHTLKPWLPCTQIPVARYTGHRGSAIQWSQGCFHPRSTGPSFLARYMSWHESANNHYLDNTVIARKTTLKLPIALQNIYREVGPAITPSDQRRPQEIPRTSKRWRWEVPTGWTCTGWSVLDHLRQSRGFELVERR